MWMNPRNDLIQKATAVQFLALDTLTAQLFLLKISCSSQLICRTPGCFHAFSLFYTLAQMEDVSFV